MSGRSNGCPGGGGWPLPAPLGGLEDLEARSWAAERAALRAALAETRMGIHRASAPLPAPESPAAWEAADLLRQQNALLTEILGALNARLSLDLERRREG